MRKKRKSKIVNNWRNNEKKGRKKINSCNNIFYTFLQNYLNKHFLRNPTLILSTPSLLQKHTFDIVDKYDNTNATRKTK